MRAGLLLLGVDLHGVEGDDAFAGEGRVCQFHQVAGAVYSESPLEPLLRPT